MHRAFEAKEVKNKLKELRSYAKNKGYSIRVEKGSRLYGPGQRIVVKQWGEENNYYIGISNEEAGYFYKGYSNFEDDELHKRFCEYAVTFGKAAGFKMMLVEDPIASKYIPDIKKFPEKHMTKDDNRIFMFSGSYSTGGSYFYLDLEKDYVENLIEMFDSFKEFLNKMKENEKTFTIDGTIHHTQDKFHAGYYYMGHNGVVNVFRGKNLIIVDKTVEFEREVFNKTDVIKALQDIMKEVEDRKRLVNLVEPPMRHFKEMFSKHILNYGPSANLAKRCFNELSSHIPAEKLEELSMDIHNVKKVVEERITIFELFGYYFVFNTVDDNHPMWMYDNLAEANQRFNDESVRMENLRHEERLKAIENSKSTIENKFNPAQ